MSKNRRMIFKYHNRIWSNILVHKPIGMHKRDRSSELLRN
jgi:hypothetical protein